MITKLYFLSIKILNSPYKIFYNLSFGFFLYLLYNITNITALCMNDHTTDTFWKDLFLASQSKKYFLHKQIFELQNENMSLRLDNTALQNQINDYRLLSSSEMSRAAGFLKENLQLRDNLEHLQMRDKRISENFSTIQYEYAQVQTRLLICENQQNALMSELAEAKTEVNKLRNESLATEYAEIGIIQDFLLENENTKNFMLNKRDIPLQAEEKVSIQSLSKKPRNI